MNMIQRTSKKEERCKVRKEPRWEKNVALFYLLFSDNVYLHTDALIYKDIKIYKDLYKLDSYREICKSV